MTMFRMPLFTWTILVTMLLVLLATPVFTSALVMLLIDRNLGGSFFNPANGGIASCGRTCSGSTRTRRCT